MTTRIPRRIERFSIRGTEEQRSLLEAAAALEGEELTTFILTAAEERAENVLAMRRSFRHDAEAWVKFNQALDVPARDLPKLRALMKGKETDDVW